jgi:hypothetical protein
LYQILVETSNVVGDLECARHRQQLACPFLPTILAVLARSLAGETDLVELQTLAAAASIRQ